MSLIFTVVIAMLIGPGIIPADEPVTLGGELLEHDASLPVHWMYFPGDDPSLARVDFDDSSWDTASTFFLPDDPPIKWSGVGWFRLHLNVEPELVGQPLALRYWRSGNFDLYLDGKQIVTAGQDDEWSIICFTEPGAHVLAARFQLDLNSLFLWGKWYVGFSIEIGFAEHAVSGGFRFQRENTFIQVLFSAIPLAFALLHFVFFIFMPQTRSNAWYALLLILWSAGVFLDLQVGFTNGMVDSIVLLRMHRATMLLVTIVSLRFVYSVFVDELPWRFWLFSGIIIAAGIPMVLWPIDQAFQFFILLQIVVLAEQIRVIAGAIRSGVDAAWLFLVGIVSVVAFGTYDALLDLEVIQPINGVTNAYFIGHLGMFICMTIYLARRFALNWKQLREEEIRRLIVETDNTRKTREMEEARELQLSMLPGTFPKVPNYEIAVRMRTATEVGGDFYDGAMQENGWFKFCIGDATGHGLRAGFMTFLFKTLFDSRESGEDLVTFMHHCDQTFGKFRMRGVRAALQAAMLKGPQLKVCSAGIPPFYVHRAASNEIEEILIPGMMLGGTLEFPFEQREISIEQGDTILFITDGLPELLNCNDEEFGYERVIEMFGKFAHLSPHSILDELYKAADNWAGESAWGDDITLLVFRYRKS